MTATFFSAKIGDTELFTVSADKVPSINRTSFLLSDKQSDLFMIDSQETKHNFDLSSVLSEGFNWIDLCVQISKDYVVLADCRLGNDGIAPDDPENIMFQPIFLPECVLKIETKGRNVQNRGFFSWWSGSRNLSLMGICDYCQKSFRLSVIHSGRSQEINYYCEQGIHTLLAKPNREYHFADKNTHSELMSKLPTCNKCGSKFANTNPFRCVHCGKPYLDLQAYPEESEGYYALSLYGEEFQRFSYY